MQSRPRVSHLGSASALLVLGAMLLLAGLPLRWSAVATADGRISLSLRGVDYPAYDIVTTVALGLLLLASAFAVGAVMPWGRALAAVAALLACFWAGLVYLAAAVPSAGTAGTGRVTVTVGAGAYLLAAGALMSLLGALLGLRHRGARAAPTAQVDGG